MKIWKPIHSLNDKYEASDNGQIRNAKTKKIKSIAFDGHYWKFGYDYVFEGKRHMGWYRVHKAVAETFIPNPENKPTVNHIDGDHANNAVENLEWATAKEQSEHASKILKKGCGENHYSTKLKNSDVKEMRRLYEQGCKSVIEIADLYKITVPNARRIVKYERWQNI
jgi:hypothetical protein